MCVETLKRDWDASLRLYDVLVTISCLLIQPNSASALNAEAGLALDRGWAVFERRAKMMTGIHAPVPKDLSEAVRDSKRRGEEAAEGDERDDGNGSRRRKTGKTAAAAAAAAVAKVDEGAGEENAQSSKAEKVSRGEGKSTAEPLSQAPENVLGISGIRSTNSSELTSSMESDARMPTTSSSHNRNQSEDLSRRQPARDPLITAAPEKAGSTTPLKSPPPQASLLSPSHGSLAEPLYLSWYKGLMVERTPERMAREKSEHRRLKAAGWDLKLYNRGVAGGVREKRGLKRL